MRQRVRLAVSALVLLLTTMGVVVIAEPAYAACSGASCVHQEANAQGCSGTTLASVRPPGGGPLILLRWSAGCVSNWARFDDGNTPGHSPGSWNYWVETNDGHREDKLFNQAMWTFKVNGN